MTKTMTVIMTIIALIIGILIGRINSTTVYAMTTQQEKEIYKTIGLKTHYMIKSIHLANALNECRGLPKYTPNNIN